jgi:uncharacterized membrane protein
MGATPAVSSRYITQLLPMLLLLEVGMIAAAARRFAPRHAGLALAVVCALVSAQPLLAILGHNRIVSQTDTRVLATRWLEENVSKNIGGDGAKGERIAYAGSVFMPYGRPVPPRAAVVVTAGLDAAELTAKGVDYLVTHEHPLSFSTLDAAAMDALAPHLTLVADFDPRAGGDPEVEAIFEDVDAYYVPFHGFASVARPGPHVRIYAVGR